MRELAQRVGAWASGALTALRSREAAWHVESKGPLTTRRTHRALHPKIRRGILVGGCGRRKGAREGGSLAGREGWWQGGVERAHAPPAGHSTNLRLRSKRCEVVSWGTCVKCWGPNLRAMRQARKRVL